MNSDIQKAFHEAVKKNDVETARRMITAGADVNAPDDSDWHPLLSACCNGYYELVRLLVESGADVNARNKYGDTPLLECDSYYPEIIKLLLDSGALVNVRDNETTHLYCLLQ